MNITVIKNRGIATIFGKKLLKLGNATAVVLKMPQWHPPYFTPGKEYPVTFLSNGFYEITTDDRDVMFTDPTRWDAIDRKAIGYAVCRYNDTFQGQLSAGQTYAIVGETKGYWLVKRDDSWEMPTDHKFGLYKKKRFGPLCATPQEAFDNEVQRDRRKAKQKEAYAAAEKRKAPAPVEAKPKQYVRALGTMRTPRASLWETGDILVVINEYDGHYDLRNMMRDTPFLMPLHGFRADRFEKISQDEANEALFAAAKAKKVEAAKRLFDDMARSIIFGTPINHGPLIPVAAPPIPIIAIPEGKTKVRVTPGVHDSYTIEFL